MSNQILLRMRKVLPIRIATVALLLAGCATVAAQDNNSSEERLSYYLMIAQKDGSQVKVAFKHHPEFRHDGAALQLTSQGLDISYPDGTLDYFKIIAETDTPTGIYSPSTNSKDARPLMTTDGVCVAGAQPGDYLYVYTLDGKIVGNAVVDPEGSAEVSLSRYGAGTYIIKSGNTTFKMIKK